MSDFWLEDDDDHDDNPMSISQTLVGSSSHSQSSSFPLSLFSQPQQSQTQSESLSQTQTQSQTSLVLLSQQTNDTTASDLSDRQRGQHGNGNGTGTATEKKSDPFAPQRRGGGGGGAGGGASMAAFVCETCGADVPDAAGDDGAFVCPFCYTQSQARQSQALEYDEVVNLAAKTAVGGIQRMSTGGAGGGYNKNRTNANNANTDDNDGPRSNVPGRKKLPLEDLDRSQPLPTLRLCLRTFQTVLQRATINMAHLISEKWTSKRTGDDRHDDGDNNNKHNHGDDIRRYVETALLSIVRRIWTGYLRSWHLGATYYGRHHPTIRFSLRDRFLTTGMRGMLYRTIADTVATEEGTTMSERKQQKGPHHWDDDDKEDDNEDDDEEEEEDDDMGDDVDIEGGNDDEDNEDNDIGDDTTVLFGKRKRHVHNTSNAAADDSNNSKKGKYSSNRLRQTNVFAQLMYRMTLLHRLQQQHHQSSRDHTGNENVNENHDDMNTKNYYCREAALLLQPSITLVVSILYAASMRAGIAPHEMIQWIQQDKLKGVMGDTLRAIAVASEQSNNSDDNINHYTKMMMEPGMVFLRPFFRNTKLPTVRIMEHQAKLLLLASGVKSFSEWRGAEQHHHQQQTNEYNVEDNDDGKDSKHTLLLSVANVPSLMAQCAADLDLGQDVLRTGLYLIGLEAQVHGKTAILLHYSHIKSTEQVLAILVCATVLTTSEWSFVRKNKSRYHDNNSNMKTTTTTTTMSMIPWNEEDLTHMTNGDAKGYVDFYTSFEEQGSVCPEFTDLLKQQEQEYERDENAASVSRTQNFAILDDDEDEDQNCNDNVPQKNKEKEEEEVRACPLAMLGVRREDKLDFPLRRLVLEALRLVKKRRSYKKFKKQFSSLAYQEDILIDFVAFTCHVPRLKLLGALEQILYTRNHKLRIPTWAQEQTKKGD